MQLNKFLDVFTQAIELRNWALLSELDQQMRDVVDNEKSVVLAESTLPSANKLASFDTNLKQLSALYQQAQALAANERDLAAKKLEELAVGKVGISEYNYMSAL